MKLFNNFRKIVLVVEYNGERYYGFQWQMDLPTIQSELEKAISKVTGETVRVLCASRTDTGVHATGQVVSFRTASNLTPGVMVRALNYYLPRDISVRGACDVSESFNVQKHALSREYEYKILNSSIRSPLAEGLSYLVMSKLKIEEMKSACKILEGEHDLASFVTSLQGIRSTKRTIYEASVTKEGDTVTFHIVANSFMPHQVRNTVGLLIRVGSGKVMIEEFKQIIEKKTPGLAGPTVPALGLCLTRVNYPNDSEFKYENLFN